MENKSKDQITIDDSINKEYEYGFVTNIEQDTLPPGLDENVIKIISKKKDEPQWLLNWRLKAFKYWKTLKDPNWAKIKYPEIDYQSISYFSAPKKKKLNSLISGFSLAMATMVKVYPIIIAPLFILRKGKMDITFFAS